MNLSPYPIPILCKWPTYHQTRLKGADEITREQTLIRENARVIVPVLMDDDAQLWWPMRPLMTAAGAKVGTTAAQYIKRSQGALDPYVDQLPNPHVRGPKTSWHIQHAGLKALFRMGRTMAWQTDEFRNQTIRLDVGDVIDLSTTVPESEIGR